jgi:hypothetical protein
MSGAAMGGRHDLGRAEGLAALGGVEPHLAEALLGVARLVIDGRGHRRGLVALEIAERAHPGPVAELGRVDRHLPGRRIEDPAARDLLDVDRHRGAADRRQLLVDGGAEEEREVLELGVAVVAEERDRLVHEPVDRLLVAHAGLPDRAAGQDATHRAVAGSLLQPQHLRHRRVDPPRWGRLANLFARVLRPLLLEAACHRTALNCLGRPRTIRG